LKQEKKLLSLFQTIDMYWWSPKIFLLLQVNNTIYTYSPTQKVLEPNFVVGAPSSARLPEAGSQLNCVVLPGNLIMENYNRSGISWSMMEKKHFLYMLH
jgi:hypothetical protein